MKNIKETHIHLMRTKKRIMKLEKFHINKEYRQLKSFDSSEIDDQYDQQYQELIVEGLGINSDNNKLDKSVLPPGV